MDKLKGCMVDLLEKHGNVTAEAAAAAEAATGLLEAPSASILSVDMGGFGSQACSNLLTLSGCGAAAKGSSVLGLGWGCGLDSMEMTGMGLLDGLSDTLLMGYGSMDGGSSLISMMQDGGMMMHGGFGAPVEMIECHN